MENKMEDRKMWVSGANQTIFEKGEPIEFAGLIIDGIVNVQWEGGIYQIGAGDVIGFAGLREGVHSCTYHSENGVKMCPFLVKGETPLEHLLSGDSKTVSIILRSLANHACKRMGGYLRLYEESEGIFRILTTASRKYQDYAAQILGVKPDMYDWNSVEPFYEECEIGKELQQFYTELGSVSLDDIQRFAGERHAVARYLAEDVLDFMDLLGDYCEKLIQISQRDYEEIVSGKKDCLLLQYFRLYKTGVDEGADLSFFQLQINYLLQILEDIEGRSKRERGLSFGYSKEKWIEVFALYKGSAKAEEGQSQANEEEIRSLVEKELRDSMNRLVQYSGIEEEKQSQFLEYWKEYVGMKNKGGDEEELRRILRRIEEIFYDIYEGVFLHAEEDKNSNLYVRLFLNFGFMDEKIFQEKDLIALYSCQMQLEKAAEMKYNVYTIYQWLQAIYSGKKEPSKNEFDMDYREVFLDMKRTRRFTPGEEAAYFADSQGKLRFEIKNMFRKNNRQISGQMGFFCPVLTGEQLLQGIEGNFLTYEEIENGMDELRKIDFSAFYRETMYQNPEKKIERAQIMVEVLPDIILMPGVGIRGSMWQDIEGKRRVSPGRFILPIFLCGDINEILYKLVGKFRWELCRTIQGAYWNNMTEKSLTAEFYDYLQFYKKNRDLNDQAKQKIRDKMKQYRNNFSEIFVSDYVQWIRYESKGASKLNRVARDILLRYCPFAKEYRDALGNNPMFSESIGIWERKNDMKIRAVLNQQVHLEKAGAEITQELKDTLDFYRM